MTTSQPPADYINPDRRSIDERMANNRKPPAVPAEDTVTISRDLLECLIDESECWFDHHGGCQEHGYLSLKPGEKCPHQEAKEILAKKKGA